jgi:hypothetical protein
MKCAVEMGSDGMIYVPSFIKIGSDIKCFFIIFFRLHNLLMV